MPVTLVTCWRTSKAEIETRLLLTDPQIPSCCLWKIGRRKDRAIILIDRNHHHRSHCKCHNETTIGQNHRTSNVLGKRICGSEHLSVSERESIENHRHLCQRPPLYERNLLSRRRWPRGHWAHHPQSQRVHRNLRRPRLRRSQQCRTPELDQAWLRKNLCRQARQGPRHPPRPDQRPHRGEISRRKISLPAQRRRPHDLWTRWRRSGRTRRSRRPLRNRARHFLHHRRSRLCRYPRHPSRAQYPTHHLHRSRRSD